MPRISLQGLSNEASAAMPYLVWLPLITLVGLPSLDEFTETTLPNGDVQMSGVLEGEYSLTAVIENPTVSTMTVGGQRAEVLTAGTVTEVTTTITGETFEITDLNMNAATFLDLITTTAVSGVADPATLIEAVYDLGWTVVGRGSRDVMLFEDTIPLGIGQNIPVFTGDDTFLGRGGNDRLSMGDGNDRGVGGAGRDRIDGGRGNDVLLGNGGKDKLNGNGGRDKLEGGAGADILVGGAGRDVLKGGGGADTFVLNGNSGRDIIRDFVPGVDTLRFVNSTEGAATETDRGVEVAHSGGTAILIGLTLDDYI